MASLKVNGQIRSADVLPQETLAMTLSYRLRFTGTRLGCDRAEWDACTVLIDHVANCPSRLLHPVQQAFVDELGPQCGFGTPGQVMSAVALLANPNPARVEARRATSGNLCRCGANDHHPNSIMRAALGLTY